MTKRLPNPQRPEKSRTDAERAELVGRICERIEAGAHITHAAALEGVARRTFYGWLADEAIAVRVERARAVAAEDMRAELVEMIRDGEKTAKTMLDLMERMHPNEYRPAEKRVEHSGGTTQQVVVQITDAERKQITVAAREKYRARELTHGTQEADGDDDE